MEIQFFVFSVEVFQFFEFHENKAKRDRHNFERNFTITRKIWLKFYKLTFLWVNNQIVSKFY